MRSSHAASFGRALDMTTLLRVLLHVRHAFEAEEKGAAPSDDPVTPAMMVQARVLQDAFLQLLGRDLTVYDPYNRLHHTGNPVPLHAGEFKSRRPWEWLWRVADGRSNGKLRGRSETWQGFALRMVYDHFFTR